MIPFLADILPAKDKSSIYSVSSHIRCNIDNGSLKITGSAILLRSFPIADFRNDQIATVGLASFGLRGSAVRAGSIYPFEIIEISLYLIKPLWILI